MIIEDILALEEKRRLATNASDADTLDALLADNFVQIHADGRQDDKASTLDLVRSRRGGLQPRQPSVRVLGDIAFLTGPGVHRVEIAGEIRDFHVLVGQVAIRVDGTWRFAQIQATSFVPPEQDTLP